LVTTSSLREKETANRLSAIATLEPAIDEPDNLRDQTFGDREDLPSDFSEAFWKDPTKNLIPNVESFADAVQGVTETVERFNNHHTAVIMT